MMRPVAKAGIPLHRTISGGGTYLKYREFSASDDISFSIGEMASTTLRPFTQAILLNWPLDAGTELIYAPGYYPHDTWTESGTVRWYDGSTSLNSGLSVTTGTEYILVHRVTSTGVVTFSKYTHGSGWSHTTPTGASGFGSNSWPGSGLMHFNPTYATYNVACVAMWTGTPPDNTTVETLDNSFAAWSAASPHHLWRLDQTTPDDSIGSCDVSSITGTTITSTDSFLLVT